MNLPETIWWCEAHRQAAAPSSEHRPRCIWGDLVDNQQPCRMVEGKFLRLEEEENESAFKFHNCNGTIGAPCPGCSPI